MLPPGPLWQKVLERTETAWQTGALQSIPTDCTWVEEAGTQFMVRVLANLERKAAAARSPQLAPKDPAFNPFLPYEEALYVADVSPTHVALLNKYNVVDHHLLLITRAFESQDNGLTQADFAALALALADMAQAGIEGLAFYNGGKVAGASQRHKHLQVIPLPLAPMAAGLPMAPLLAAATFSNGIGRSPLLPFVHAIAPLSPSLFQSPEFQSPDVAASVLLESYRTLLIAIGLTPDQPPIGAYNLLATQDWLLVVRRSQESFDQIAINALGFAGSFFVRNPAELQRLKQHRPLHILTQVGVAL
jgi:sulfate adenylyltransferase (ADP) / ATP adenylyltransferase